jgi:hypothetical protein
MGFTPDPDQFCIGDYTLKKSSQLNGLYRYIRHPIYAGEFPVLCEGPFEDGAPMTMLTMVVAGISVLLRRFRLQPYHKTR